MNGCSAKAAKYWCCGSTGWGSVGFSQSEFCKRACVTDERDNWKAYAIALQNLYDNGGPLMEPTLAKEVERFRDACE